MHRFNARWLGVGRLLIGGDDLVLGIVECLLELGSPIQRDVDLFLPEPHLGTSQIVLECLFLLATISVALREVERVTRAEKCVSFRFQHSFKQLCVILKLLCVPAAATAAENLDRETAYRFPALRILRHLQELVQHTAEIVLLLVAAQMRPIVLDARVLDLDVVKIDFHRRFEDRGVETGLDKQAVIGVDDQGIVDILTATQALQRMGAVVSKILPRLIDNFSWNAVLNQPLADRLLRPISRSGVFDQHVIDQRPRAVETARDHMCFVLHDHAQADRR
jgi:hypothetical protein